MRSTSIGRMFAVGAVFLIFIPSAQAAINDGLIAHYEFDGNANDSSGNGNHATAYNDYAYVPGVSSDAIRLVGQGHTGLNGGHVLLPSLQFENMPEFTIGLWVNHQGNTSIHGSPIIRYGDGGQGDIIEIYYNTPLPGGNLGVRVGSGNVSVPYEPDFLNNWKHLTLVGNHGTMTGFVDGQDVGSASYELNSVSDVAGLGTAWWNSGSTSNRFIGMIDDVRIYDRALSNAEVEQLAAVPEPASIIIWSLIGAIGLAAAYRRRKKT